MLLPFQCVASCKNQEGLDIILAASGAWIYVFNASDGVNSFQWSHTIAQSRLNTSLEDIRNDLSGATDAEVERPGKRRKLSDADDASESTSTEIVVDGPDQPRRKRKAKNLPTPAVIKLVATLSGRYVVAVTGEDKCIRVLEVMADGGLNQLSERFMPKKPCAVTFTTDDTTILCADKFGDVYSLPLIPSITDDHMQSHGSPSTSTAPVDEKVSTRYVPSASELTVHTKRNQQALKNQLRVTNKAAVKKTAQFEHQLLLGHVSLLTDLVYVTVSAEEAGSVHTRSYLLTSDRDEHIRVSRGLPQAHITEGYCLEHAEFVSKICIPRWRAQMLLSGGGDGYLIAWDWLNGVVKQKIELKTLVDKSRDVLTNNSFQPDTLSSTSRVAVSGIWAIQTSHEDREVPAGDFIVICEGLPVLIIYSMNLQGEFKHRETLQTEGNVIDVTVIPGQRSILYSMDNLHEPSTTNVRTNNSIPYVGTCSYSYSSGGWSREGEMGAVAVAINRWAAMQENSVSDSKKQCKNPGDLLYSIEKLRKRGQDD